MHLRLRYMRSPLKLLAESQQPSEAGPGAPAASASFASSQLTTQLISVNSCELDFGQAGLRLLAIVVGLLAVAERRGAALKSAWQAPDLTIISRVAHSVLPGFRQWPSPSSGNLHQMGCCKLLGMIGLTRGNVRTIHQNFV